MLFAHVVDSFDAWAQVFQDADAFLPLAQAIYRKEGMELPLKLGRLTPGTNAVFRVRDTVIKIFAPETVGFDSARDFAVESAMLLHAQAASVRTSRPLAAGEIWDGHLFRYLILDYVRGEEAGDVLPRFGDAEKTRFVQGLLMQTQRLHVHAKGLLPELDIRDRAMHNPRLAMLPAHLAESFRKRAAGARMEDLVIVHGDLTGENVLIDMDVWANAKDAKVASDAICIIDFADACMAPASYELPPIVFELLRCDPGSVRALVGDEAPQAFVQRLVDAVTLHDFGANILMDDAKRHHLDVSEIASLDAWADVLMARVFTV